MINKTKQTSNTNVLTGAEVTETLIMNSVQTSFGVWQELKECQFILFVENKFLWQFEFLLGFENASWTMTGLNYLGIVQGMPAEPEFYQENLG